MSSEDSLKSLSLDYLNLLINGQAFSDVAFSVEGRLVHAHRCVLAARSLFFRKLFCGLDPNHQPPPPPQLGSPGARPAGAAPELVIPVSSIRYEVLVLVLQFLYSGQASVAAPKSGPLPGCGAAGTPAAAPPSTSPSTPSPPRAPSASSSSRCWSRWGLGFDFRLGICSSHLHRLSASVSRVTSLALA